MKAFVFYAPGDIRYEEVEQPRPGPGEVLVRVGAALTCGTDLKTYRRGHPLIIRSAPTVFGHEFAGTVVETGPGVEGIAVGQRVVAANSAPCGACADCAEGRPNLCEALVFLNGAYAEYVVVPAPIVRHNFLPIPDHLDFRVAALVEPLACVLHGLARSEIVPGATVAVFGAGAIGSLMATLATERGAEVVVVDPFAVRLVRVRRLGVAHTVDSREEADVVGAVRRIGHGGRGVDVAIEAAGRPELWEQAVAVVRRGGLVNFFGGCAPGTSIRLDTRRMHYDELRLIGVFHHTPAFIRQALAHLASGRVDAGAFVTHEMELARLREAFALVSAGQAIKVAITPPGAA